MAPVEIKENIYWVGAVDWNMRDFHGYSTDKGTSYNAYLALDEKTALFDTVKQSFRGDLLHNIRALIDPTQIDYIIVNHVEMDHSGCLPEIMDLVKPEKLFCSPRGKTVLLEHFHRDDWPYEVVKSGDALELGRKTVRFIETPMLHWPDSMFSYIVQDGLLISSDSFGQHLAASSRFSDEVDQGELLMQAAKYYANILLLFSNNVQKLLARVRGMGIDINMIAPDHGLIWRKDAETILKRYEAWSRQETREKAVIIYDTMWQSTEKMAKAVYSGLVSEGVTTELMNLKVNHRSDVITQVLDAKAIIFASPTLNNGMLPRMADILSYMKGLRPKGRIGAAFGSYGWSGEAVSQMNKAMEEMKFTMVDEGIRVKFVPGHEELRQCVQLGSKIGRAVKGGT